jgi:hypothetical protein
MAELSELRNLVTRSNKALALAKENAERRSREIEEKHRDSPDSVFVCWTQQIFIGPQWRHE